MAIENPTDNETNYGQAATATPDQAGTKLGGSTPAGATGGNPSLSIEGDVVANVLFDLCALQRSLVEHLHAIENGNVDAADHAHWAGRSASHIATILEDVAGLLGDCTVAASSPNVAHRLGQLQPGRVQ